MSENERLSNNRVQRTRHKVSGPLTRDVRENNMKTLIGILAIIIVSGCAPTATKSPADIYSAHHPFESKHYEMMAPISVEYIEYIAKSHHGSVDAILTGVEKRRNDPKELSYFLEHAKKMNDQALITNIPEWISLRDRLEENDAIYLFKYRIEGYEDFGILVIRDGEIVYRNPEAASWSTGLKPEGEFEIDELEQAGPEYPPQGVGSPDP